mgnify:CR=1 FL=1
MAAKSMEELLAKSSLNIKGFDRGERVKAKLVSITSKAAVFDLGAKSEGIIGGIYFEESHEFLHTLKNGEIIELTVIEPETRDGVVLLSARNAANDSVWIRLEEKKEKGEEISTTVKSFNQGGVSVDIEGASGFVPTSYLGKKALKEGEGIVGKTIKVKIIEVDKRRRKVVASEKAVSEKGEEDLLKKTLASVNEGEIYTGTVVKLTTFGAFVEIEVKKTKVEGLVHISEIAWEKTAKPEDVLKVGQKIEVKVLGMREGKLSLSIKGAMKDPWETVEKDFKVEDKIKGKVVKHSDFGVFVELKPGVEGLLHMTKIPPTVKLETGKTIDVTIEEIDPKGHKISLGLILSAIPVGYK